MIRIAACFVLLAALLGGAACRADEIADFYKGKQVTCYVGYEPGGTYDLYARMLSKYLPRFIPGNPTVVTVNMPGASSVVLGVHLNGTAPKDGTQFGLLNPSLLIDPILYEKSSVPFNPANLTLIGNLTQSPLVLVAMSSSGLRSLEDLKTKELVIAATSPTGDTYIIPQSFKNLLHLKLKIIIGYSGTKEALMALETGEISGRVWTYQSLMETRPDWVRDGKALILTQFFLPERDPSLKDVPLAQEFASDPLDRQALELAELSTLIAKPFAAPPGLPPARVKALRDAFMAVATDKEFLAEAAQRKLDVSPMSGEAMAALLKKAYASPPEVVTRLRKAIQGPQG